MYLYPGIKCWCWIFWDFVSLSPSIVVFPDHNNNKIKKSTWVLWAVSSLHDQKRGARFTVWLPRETAHDWPWGCQPSFIESWCSLVGRQGFADVPLDDTWCQPSMVPENLCAEKLWEAFTLDFTGETETSSSSSGEFLTKAAALSLLQCNQPVRLKLSESLSCRWVWHRVKNLQMDASSMLMIWSQDYTTKELF